MSKGIGSKEVRKLQLTGGSTYTLSLPKYWIDVNKLTTSDGIEVDWRPSGALRLTPATGVNEIRRRSIVIQEDIPDGAIFDHLVGSYLSGADQIDFLSRNVIERKSKRVIRQFLKTTRGFEISSETDKEIILISLLRPSEMPLRASINRMYQQLTSLIRDISEVMSGGDYELIEDHEEREQEIDSMRLLVERQVSSLLDSYKVAEALNLGRREAVEFANLSRSLERMADHANQLSELIITTDKIPEMDHDLVPLSLIPIWQNAMRILMINLREQNAEEIGIARSKLKKSKEDLLIYEEELWTNKESPSRILFKFKFSESIRRICSYSRDFGEIILNIMAHSNIIEEK